MTEKTHELKTWPGPFEAVRLGDKHVEIRRDDRGFEVGHELLLKEWRPNGEGHAGQAYGYTGRELLVRVTHIVNGGFGLRAGFVAMSIERSDLADEGPHVSTGCLGDGPCELEVGALAEFCDGCGAARDEACLASCMWKRDDGGEG